MPICKDCEMEVEKLNKEGICHQCYIRKTNNVYLNKKNGTNNPYVPLKDIKGTIEYNRVMGRRAATNKKKNPQVTVTKTTYKIMNENKALGSMMSGSGPTVFGLFENKEDALRGKEELLKIYEQVYVVNSSQKGVEVDG